MFVIAKFIRICLDGDTDYQEPVLIVIMLIQIAFRKIIFDCLTQDSWFVPGISMELLYRMFLPVYRVCLGRCIIEFAEKREEWNFGLMFPVCLGMPVMVNEIELQVRKILRKEGETETNCKKGFRSKLMWMLSNLSSIAEGMVLGFLVLCLYLPNVRYMYLGEEMLMRRIIDLVWKLGIILFVVVVFVYLKQLYDSGKQSLKDWQ